VLKFLLNKQETLNTSRGRTDEETKRPVTVSSTNEGGE